MDINCNKFINIHLDLFFFNSLIICFGTSSNQHCSNGETITLPMTYTTFWKGFGSGVNISSGNNNCQANIAACLFKSKSQAFVCNRSTWGTTENDYINYLVIGY